MFTVKVANVLPGRNGLPICICSPVGDADTIRSFFHARQAAGQPVRMNEQNEVSFVVNAAALVERQVRATKGSTFNMEVSETTGRLYIVANVDQMMNRLAKASEEVLIRQLLQRGQNNGLAAPTTAPADDDIDADEVDQEVPAVDQAIGE